MTDREKLIAKIRALLEKTAGRGCTEAEALAAAEKAAQLMREYGVNDLDIEFTRERQKEREQRTTWRTPLVAIIAFVTNTAAINLRGQEVIEFWGQTPGPEIAAYLRDICLRAVTRAQREFKAGAFYRRRRGLASKRAAVADFTEAMVSRLCVRLVDLFKDVRDDAARTAARNAVAERYAGAVANVRKPRKERHSEAGWQGWTKGADVPLNRGVHGDARPMIGDAK
ncbi:MAG: DUF2786 domain-containing protein [Rhodoblastus sp.]